MEFIINKRELTSIAVCFADKTLLLAQSLAREDALIAGMLIESALEMATFAVETDVMAAKGLRSRAVDRMSRVSCHCEAMLRLLKVRGAIGDVTCASLLADLMRIRQKRED